MKNLPPLKVFMGWNPVKECISKLNQCYIDAELKKCYHDTRYYYNKYWQINGNPVNTVSQETWDAMLNTHSLTKSEWYEY